MLETNVLTKLKFNMLSQHAAIFNSTETVNCFLRLVVFEKLFPFFPTNRRLQGTGEDKK